MEIASATNLSKHVHFYSNAEDANTATATRVAAGSRSRSMLPSIKGMYLVLLLLEENICGLPILIIFIFLRKKTPTFS